MSEILSIIRLLVNWEAFIRLIHGWVWHAKMRRHIYKWAEKCRSDELCNIFGFFSFLCFKGGKVWQKCWRDDIRSFVIVKQLIKMSECSCTGETETDSDWDLLVMTRCTFPLPPLPPNTTMLMKTWLANLVRRRHFELSCHVCLSYHYSRYHQCHSPVFVDNFTIGSY